MCLQIGLTLSDFCWLDVSTLFDIIDTYSDLNKKSKQKESGVREATQKDIDAFFHR